MKSISNEEAAALLKKTEEVEAEKEARKLEREEKKLRKEAQKKQAFLEKLVAPILLIITIMVSVVLYLAR